MQHPFGIDGVKISKNAKNDKKTVFFEHEC